MSLDKNLLKLSTCALEGPKTIDISYNYTYEIQLFHTSLLVSHCSCTLWQVHCK